MAMKLIKTKRDFPAVETLLQAPELKHALEPLPRPVATTIIREVVAGCKKNLDTVKGLQPKTLFAGIVERLQIEATKGSMTEEDQVLTIYSRIGNTSEQPLPYPLVHISLTDRFEEIIGSRVREPAEYLVGNSDPRRPVNKGRTFDAVFTINTPSVDVTGFKLNVCYRLTSGQLRCAIEDFK